MSLFVPVPQNHILTSGANSALTWTNAVSVSSMNVSSLGASALSVSTLTTSSSVTASTLTTGRLNYSSIVGSSISSNTLTLSLTNASTQNTQIYQVATTNPTTSYTAIQASHVSTGTTNNALALNPSGGNVGVGTTAPAASLHVINPTAQAGNTAMVTAQIIARPLTGGVQENMSGGFAIGAATSSSNSVARMDVMVAGNPSAGNSFGQIPNVSVATFLGNGNVGIGTTTPSTLLDITNATSLTPAIRIQNQFSAGYVSMGSNVGVNSFIGLQATNTTTSALTTPALAVVNNGNVGIGYTAPATTLHIVNPTLQAGNPTMVTAQIIGRPATGGLQNAMSCGFAIGAATSSINSVGRMNVMVAGAAVAGNDFGFIPDVPVMTLLGSGNVGIGTTTPTTLLDVKNGTNADSTGQPAGPFIARIYNAFNGNAQGGLFIKNNWANSNATLLEVGNDFLGGSYCSYLSIDGVGNTRFKVNNGAGVSRDVLYLQQTNAYVGIGTTAPIAPLHVTGTTAGNDIALFFLNASRVAAINASANAVALGWNAANSILYVARDSATNRSVNAAGTFNASGADYAEYMTKDSDFPAQKGDLLGVLPSGKLTNQFDDAIHFLLKSTNPCMVGGDVWGTDAIVGEKPKEPENATEEEKAAHAIALAAWEARLEAERQKVDRMAFAGQVPVNILGATPGNYIIPLRNADGSIGVAAVAQADMTFSQYQSAVGRVISILEDGRANVIVKAV